jgi:uncharacterized GH25 family protein
MRTNHNVVHTLMRRAALAVVAFAIAALTTSAAAAQSKTPAKGAGKVDIALTQPTTIKSGENQFAVMVKGADGKPIADADVSVLFVMPAMPAMKMPEMRNEVKLKPAGEGKYTGSGNVPMAGKWNVTVSVKKDGKVLGQKKQTVTAK